jgi:hypothetical protein
VSRPTQVSYSEPCACRIRDCHPLWLPFPVAFSYARGFSLRGLSYTRPCKTLQPRYGNAIRLAPYRFRLFPVRSPLLRESLLISSPPGTEMVQFPGSRFRTLCVQARTTGHHSGRVTPFGNLRISGCVLLPTAFRSLPRPSSPDSSKASTVNSYSLDHISSSPPLLSKRQPPQTLPHLRRDAGFVRSVSRLLPYTVKEHTDRYRSLRTNHVYNRGDGPD